MTDLEINYYYYYYCYLIVMFLKSQQFWKPGDEQAVHGVLRSDHQLIERPESILVRVEIHEEQSSYL